MKFTKFNQQIQLQFKIMCSSGKLFRSNVPGSKIWETYLSSFKPENNKVFRDPESSEHNCNCCHNFIRRYGNIVSIDSDGKLVSIFSNIGDVGEYTDSAEACNNLLVNSEIQDVFFETFNELDQKLNYESCKKYQDVFQLGIKSNYKKYSQEEADKFGVVNATDIYKFDHFNVQLPKQFVDVSGNSIENIMAHFRDKYQVFKRAMEEIPLDTLNLVKDLINQGSLLDGNAHLHSVEEMVNAHELLPLRKYPKELFYWIYSYELDERSAKFKNTLIGVLCTELAEGLELNKACENWNKRVDPVNYHKATAPITKRQIEEAKKFVEENGYIESFDRRLATLDDIKASEIKHINVGDGSVKKVSIFDNVKATSTRHKRSQFDGIEEVGIDKFMKDILPSCTHIEAFFENRMEGNLSVLTTTRNEESKPIFKWDNNYSWTFNGNLAGKSQIKEAVKTAGGKVDGVLRFSIMWSGDNVDNSDLDAHCIEPGGFEIYFGEKRSRITEGNLDIDITQPLNQMPKGAVENITYPSLSKMVDGTYKFFVHQYCARSSNGFKAEIEFNGESFFYEYNQPVLGDVWVANVILKNGEFLIEHKLPETNQSKELWGLETNAFHKVNLVCLSPNHWGENKIGNLHYFFMLEGCGSKNDIRGFHNENLKPELLNHRKVMEVLGATNMIKANSNQLAGIGFNSTVKDELIIRCSGNFKRTLKIKF
jgi:hypothetical protein